MSTFLEFDDYIWNHLVKCIQTSTNMPGIGWVSCEIAFENLRILRKHTQFCVVKPLVAF